TVAAKPLVIVFDAVERPVQFLTGDTIAAGIKRNYVEACNRSGLKGAEVGADAQHRTGRRERQDHHSLNCAATHFSCPQADFGLERFGGRNLWDRHLHCGVTAIVGGDGLFELIFDIFKSLVFETEMVTLEAACRFASWFNNHFAGDFEMRAGSAK